MAAEALKKDDLGPLRQMKTRLVLGKSLVPGSVTGDVFEGTLPGPIPFKRMRGYEAEVSSGVSAELGGPWAFYRQFWKAHDLPGIEELFAPQMGVGVSSDASIPILLHNDTGDTVTLEVTAQVPAGWGEAKGIGRYPVRAHETRAVSVSMQTPSKGGTMQQVQLHVSGPTGRIAELRVAVSVN
jgi:hypothetical protein